MKLSIETIALQLMETHAEEAFPNECCGFFYGREENGIRIVQQAQRAPNSKKGDQRRRFEVAPEDYLAAERYALRQDTTLLGIYHSHPQHPAIPSEHDLKQAVPFFSYIIVSVRDGKAVRTRSWQLNDTGLFAEEKIAESQPHS